MGLRDRDYMHEKSRRQRPFSPPPERFNLGTLGMVLVVLAVLAFLYKVADWKLNQRALRPVADIAQPVATPAQQTLPTPPAPAFPAQPAYRQLAQSPSGTSQVTKCVVNGKTSYGDDACPRGAVASQVTTRADHNLMAAVRPGAASPPAPPQAAAVERIVDMQTNPIHPALAQKIECEGLEKQIEHWDAMARHPQSAQMQDWIRDQRKQARDRQFQIRCR